MKINTNKAIAVFFLIALLGALASMAGDARQAEDPGVLLRAAIEKEEVDGDLQGAIDLYKQIVAKYSDSRGVAARALIRLGGCYEKLGLREATSAYQRVLADYPDRTEEVGIAREKLSLLMGSRVPMQAGPAGITLRQVWSDSNPRLCWRFRCSYACLLATARAWRRSSPERTSRSRSDPTRRGRSSPPVAR